MASKVWKRTTSIVAARSVQLALAPGDVLTGKFYFELDSNTPELSVEVWSRTQLILQSKTIPAIEGVPSVDLAMVAKFRTDSFVVGDLTKIFDEQVASTNSDALILSCCQAAAGLVIWSAYFEVQSR